MVQKVPHHNPRLKLQPCGNSDSKPQYYLFVASVSSEALKIRRNPEKGNEAVAKNGVWVIVISENQNCSPNEHWKQSFSFS